MNPTLLKTILQEGLDEAVERQIELLSTKQEDERKFAGRMAYRLTVALKRISELEKQE